MTSRRALVLLALGAAACVPPSRKPPAMVAFELWPRASTVQPGDPLAFAASRAATFSVEESGGGAIDASGLYVAPAAPGVYHVLATSDAGERASAVVRVAPLALDLVAGLPGGSGSVDGGARAAHFVTPTSIAYDGRGHLFVADGATHTIRAVALGTGFVSTLAGRPGVAGFLDGVGLNAAFRSPQGVASGGDGWVYVADTDNACIRRVRVADGTVELVAGHPQPHQEGSVDGVGTDARFNIPMGVALDGAGRLFVADPENNVIRAVDLATRDATTFAGAPGPPGHVDAVGTAARFNTPLALAFDGARTLYVVDRLTQLLRTVDVETAQVGTLAMLGDFPIGLAADTKTVYVAFASNVVAFDAATGARTLVAGSTNESGFADGGGTQARFDHATGLALVAGTLYVTDGNNHVVRAIDLESGEVTTVEGALSPGAADGQRTFARFDVPVGVASDDAGTVYVADSSNHTIRAIAPDGTVTTLAGLAGAPGRSDGVGAAARFNHPSGLACDGTHLYVADSDNALIRRVDLVSVEVAGVRGQTITIAGGAHGSLDGRGLSAGFVDPFGVAWDGAGTLYITDFESHVVRALALATGEVTTIAGTPNVAGGYDGMGADARFDGPAGIAADRLGHLYVADSYGRTIRRVTLADGSVTTFVGEYTIIGGADGPGALARLAAPGWLAGDGAGNLWIADPENHAVRRVVARDVATQVGHGFDGAYGVAFGPLPAQLGSPLGLALTPAGELVILDENAVLIVH
jgi:sugar lactone lactonase YvrE